jgi:hypothetical protein
LSSLNRYLKKARKDLGIPDPKPSLDDASVTVTMPMSDYIRLQAVNPDLPFASLLSVSFALYKACREAEMKGKHVGVADSAESLTQEFTGF